MPVILFNYRPTAVEIDQEDLEPYLLDYFSAEEVATASPDTIINLINSSDELREQLSDDFCGTPEVESVELPK